MNFFKFFLLKKCILFLLLIFAWGCSSYDTQYKAMFDAYYRNDIARAEELSEGALRDIGYDSQDRPLLLLENASISLAAGKTQKAIASLREADEMTEVLDLSGDPGEVGKYLFSDSSGMYRIQPHEQIMVNVLNAILYLSIGDISSANVEIKRAKTQEKYWVDIKGQNMAKNALLQFMGLLISRRLNKISDSSFYEREFKQFVGEGNSRDFLKPLSKGEKEILVVVLHGKGPVKEETKELIPGSQAARIISRTGYRGDYLIYPAIRTRYSSSNLANVMVNSDSFGSCMNLLDIESQALSWYAQQKEKIMIAAASRMAIRAAASTAAAKGAEYALKGREDKHKKKYGYKRKHQKNTNHDEFAESIGKLIGSLTQMTMEALDAADTRCWTLLPKNILVKRIVGNFPDQVHVDLRMSAAYGKMSRKISLGSGINVVLFVAP